MALRSKTQRTLLLSFIASIAFCGLVGIYCLILGTFDELAGRVLITTAAVGAASILALASAIPWERRRWNPIGMCGLVVVGLSLLLVLGAIWWPPLYLDTEWFYKLMFISCVAAVAAPHVGLLSLARLRRQYEWIRIAGVIVIVLLAGQITLSIAIEIAIESWYRSMGVLGILDVCGTIAVPVLHLISTIRAREDIQTVDAGATISMTCPRCGKSQKFSVGRSRCNHCDLKLSIEIEEEHCSKCGYSLYKIESAVCPECGTLIAGEPRNDQT